MNNRETINRYFSLFDSMDKQLEALEQIVSLFSDSGAIVTADGNIFRGKKSIEDFFKDFFTQNEKVNHSWVINEGATLSAHWSATVTTSDQNVLTSEGTDYYEFDTDGKIKELKMTMS
ncbi:nuclear transport factor 2 family protein [Tetragenococcus muriaticus]|uniref:nuclear transport factor 2 family protein n=1 Tax=Tetragenococcus muriaticus TaxID=64642 RepID=UPI0004121513|nr:nuclear transport factor 2 family protein [Tetragenococcus muriaticus]GMA47580.1 hypothetical protein GCM10025854_18300 [Tetragenococcus muriaticus]